mmetsp:Transcript_44430/g.93272  ORF Transcript_44430/g.93272 Transcript_44430/m.93272 type:complete len:446 (-) Transcript_44430:563-1900(-)
MIRDYDDVVQPTILSQPITFPISNKSCPNRLIKAALTEGLADPNENNPNEKHYTLYKQWTGCGMVQSGNVMVDRLHRENTRNVVLDTSSNLKTFKTWGDSIHSIPGKPMAILQISHPGRQSPMACTVPFDVTPVAPSSGLRARLVLPGWLGEFLGSSLIRPARALQQEELPAIVQKFATAANLAEKAGWDGVAIHGAHGYLLSQFLSASANHRSDDYGGSPLKRQRLLKEVVAAVRKATSPGFVVGVKINTKDRATDGIERENECLELIRGLSKLEQIDFLELSGGNFEDVMFLHKANKSGERGFFASYSERVVKEVKLDHKSPKIVLTGGFRTKAGMEQVIESGSCDMVGLGRPIIMNPAFAQEVLEGKIAEANCVAIDMPFCKAMLESVLNNLWHQRQLHLMAAGLSPDFGLSFIYTLLVTFVWVYVCDFEFKGMRSKSKKID